MHDVRVPPEAASAAYNARAPPTLVAKASSIGGSNDTVDALWITTSMSAGSTPGSVSEPSCAVTRSAKMRAASSLPTRSRQGLNTGFDSSFASRSAPETEPLPRTSTMIRVSGCETSSRSSRACPTKPVPPVSRT